LSATQLKPFNPILGETFQAKVLDSLFYLEQTSHHPPILNFYVLGNKYKIYGYNESEASTGANSVVLPYKGSFYVEYADGTKHYITFPAITLTGTVVGNRELIFKGKVQIVDMINDLIAEVELNPDERGFFKKIVTSKKSYPDYFKYIQSSKLN